MKVNGGKIKAVMDGAIVWKFHATHGLPLEDSIERLARDDIVPTWDCLLLAATADGANLDTLIPRLGFAVRESYGDEFYREWEIRMKKMISGQLPYVYCTN